MAAVITKALLSLLFSFLLSSFVHAALLTEPQQLTNLTYDFVIVGAGTAGNVLASRLTENPQTRVLVVEAGISNADNLVITVPFLGVEAQRSPVDWNYTTTPQLGLNNRSIPFARGFVLGGSSSINLLVWTRGSNDVWDNFARLSGDPGWSWEAVKHFYLMTSRLVAPADGHNTAGQVNPEVHGNGPVEVSVPGFPTELDDRVIGTSKQLGGKFSFNLDYNAGKLLGFGYVQSIIGGGKRSSSATAYLQAVISRPNLDVLINTQATKLIPEPNDSQKTPVFRTLEIAQNSTGTRYRVKATREILLCGGVVGSPQLLLLSGIGPKQELENLNISSMVDLPDVGKHLVDHPRFTNYFNVNSTMTFDPVFRNQTLASQLLAEWMSKKQGLFVDSFDNTVGFMRLSNAFLASHKQQDPSAGPLSAHTEVLFTDGFSPSGATPRPTTGKFMSVSTVVVSPTSRGSITLKSADPFVHPNIDIGILQTDFDISAMLQAIKDLNQFLQAPRWRDFVTSPFGDLANATTDAALATLVRNNAVTLNHPVGTARMSPKDAPWGVTGPDLLVKGTTGLRIVDASIFPQIPECHMQAIVYTVAERAAFLIKSKYGLL